MTGEPYRAFPVVGRFAPYHAKFGWRDPVARGKAQKPAPASVSGRASDTSAPTIGCSGSIRDDTTVAIKVNLPRSVRSRESRLPSVSTSYQLFDRCASRIRLRAGAESSAGTADV